MKIVHFLGTLKKEDGVNRVLLSLIKEEKKRGVESIIVTGWVEDESISPVPVVQIRSFILPFYKEYRIPLPGMHGFEKILNEFKPDIIHIHSPDPSAWAALKYSKKNKIPIVATYHTNFCRYLSYYHLSFLQPLVWDVLKRLYKQMNFITSPSKTISQELINLNLKNIYTIPWGVELDQFNPSFHSNEWRKKILGEKEGNIILCVCRLTWEKDLRVLAEVFNLLKKHQNNFSMVIAGNGPARSELESLMPGAIFLGRIEGDELSKVYASSDIFFFSSTTETFGNVTIEAMASGIVSVVADSNGSNSLIENNKNGFLALPNNTDSFYEKIVCLLEDKQLQEKMKKTSFDIAQGYTWEKVYDNLYQKYTELIN